MPAPPLIASIWEVKETTWLLLVAIEVVEDAELDDDDEAMINRQNSIKVKNAIDEISEKRVMDKKRNESFCRKTFC